MKRLSILFSLSALLIILSSYSERKVEKYEETEVPADIQLILDKSCVMCHNKESSNTKAKTKLNFDKLYNMKKSKQIAKFSKIAKEVEEAEMPPSKFLSKYPEKGLSDEEKQKLESWAKAYAENLAK